MVSFKNNMKRLICLCLGFLVFCPISVYADEGDEGDNFGVLLSTETVNVFEKSVEDFRKIELKSRGQDSGIVLKEYIDSYDQAIEYYQTFSKSELTDMLGFTEEQANAIQNFDGTNAMRAQASVTYTANTYLTSRFYNTTYKRTETVITYDVKFSGVDYLKPMHQLAVAIAGSGAGFIRQGSSTAIAQYKSVLASGTITNRSQTFVTDDAANQAKIEVSPTYFGGVNLGTSNLQRVTIKLVGYADGNVRNMAVMTKTASRGIVWHGVGIGISTSPSASISMSLSLGWKSVASFYKSYSFI